MFRTGKQPLLAALAAALVLLVGGLWLGGHPEDLPAFLREAFVAKSQSSVVDEAVQRIASEYYRPIATGKLDSASIAGVVASLDDRFSHYLSPSEYHEFVSPPHFTGIGVDVDPQLAVNHGLLIERVFNASPAARAGLKAGELIVAVDGRKLERLSTESATSLIRGQPGTSVQLAVSAADAPRHPKRTRDVDVTRAVVSEPVVESATETVRGVKLGVVALASFTAGAHVEVREAVEHELHAGARGLVLDLRDNGGGLVEEAQLIASIFIPKGVIVTTRGRTQPTQVLLATGGAIPSSVPMVVLVDQDTASSAEIVTAALQDHHRATVVGTHTFGKGVYQEEQPLSNGGALDITVGEFFTPDGRNLGGGGVKQGAGVIPEVRVPGDVVDSTRGLDVALDTLAAKVKVK
ncbi:MAG TPA: S41 family peptidase [Solirubrobacteraceae bacterium]|nr:S41 family peptidase [Solirubrobacteraceae bacterium]